MKWIRSMILTAATAVIMTGCAHQSASGNAPGAVTGQAQSDPAAEPPQVGERFRTDTLTPGVGSALFPDPAWR